MPTYVNSKIYHANGSDIKIIDQSVIEENSGWLRDELNRLWAAIGGDTPQVQPSATIPNFITRPKGSTISRIEWSGGSVYPTSVSSGGTATLTKGTVTAYYNNIDGTATIITSNFTNTPNVISNNSSVIEIGTQSNGSITITGKAEGTTTITVKDGDKIVESQQVTVQNATNTTNVTAYTTFNVPGGSISNNTITAPTVDVNTTINITAEYNGKTATTQVPFTIIASVQPSTTYYWYVGTTKPTSLSQASTVTSYPGEQTYTNNSGAKSHIFALTNSNKNVTFINLATGNPIDQNEVDTTTISGYKIFETAVGTANTGSIIIRIS